MDLLKNLVSLTELHSKRCNVYRNYIHTIFPDEAPINCLADLPWIPVRAFKEFDLKSISNDEIYKIMQSSGTGGVQSKIFLDQETSKLQQAKLIEVFAQVFGASRYPMLVIDSLETIKNRYKFSARTAAINGFTLFSRRRSFALNDDMSINFDLIDEFLEKHSGKAIFIFGFTFVIWQHFIKQLEDTNKKYDMSNAFVLHGGGWKKLENEKVDNDEFKDRIYRAIGCEKVHNYYGMIEQTGSIYMECSHGNMHAPSGADVIIRNFDDFSENEFKKVGIIQIFSNIQKSYPGHSLLTEDIGYSLPANSCKCGNVGKVLKVLGRLSSAEVRGCSDAVRR
jgi:phenylacetate-coenzyme A ligase PaaK-like adenylate-forming protein